MEKKNIAGYISGLFSMGAGGFIALQAGIEMLVAVTEGTLAAVIPAALPIFAGSVALAAIGGKTIVNTFRGNRNSNMKNDIEEIKYGESNIRDELRKGIVQTPTPTKGKETTYSIEPNVR